MSDIQNVTYEKPAAKVFFSDCSGINDYFIVRIFFNYSSSKIEGYVYYKPCIFSRSSLIAQNCKEQMTTRYFDNSPPNPAV